MSTDGPRPETTRYLGPPVDANGRIRKYPLPLGNAESLMVMREEFTFFTPAILYLYGRFVDAPLFDCMFELGRDIKLYYHKFDWALFDGLVARSNGNSDWNHALWAVRPDDWDELANFVCSLAWSLRDEKMVFNFGQQDLTIVDPLALERAGYYHPGLPLLPLTAFGLSGNRFRAGLEVPLDPLLARPRLTVLPPTEEMVEYARCYFGGVNPVTARDIQRHLRRVAEAKEKANESAPGREPRK